MRRPLPLRAARRLSIALALAAVTAVAACGGGDAAPAATRDLLARAPHALEGDATHAPGRLALGPGGRAVLAVEAPAGSAVELDGTARGEGRLVAALAAADVAACREVALAGDVAVVPDAGGALARALPLPTPRTGPVLVELRWEGAPGSGATLERAALVGPAPPARPSVVLVSIDTLSARNLSLHGYPRATSPNLERLAADAVVFEHALANASWTTPSYASQLTGLHAGVFELEASEGEGAARVAWRVPEERWTLAERLAALGYRTAAFFDNPLAGPRFGFAQGFEVFDTSAAEIPVVDPDGGMRHVVPRALAWLDRLGPDEPFLLVVQALDCHSPYAPSERTAGRFRGDALWDGDARAPVVDSAQVFGAVRRRTAEGLFPEATGRTLPVAPLVAAYDEEVLDVDLGLGELLDGLAARGVLDRSLVVFSADHGESLLDHGWLFYHGVLYEDVLHVPLVVRPPGGVEGGRRVAATVQLVDLVPTLAELCGFALPPEATHGRSLAPLLDGRDRPPAPVLAATDVREGDALVFDGWKLLELRPGEAERAVLVTCAAGRRALAARLGPEVLDLPADRLLARLDAHPDADALVAELRAELAGPLHELYRLPDDPREEHDLAAERPDVLRRLAELLARERERVEAARARHAGGGPAAPPSEALLEEMRALGYLDEG